MNCCGVAHATEHAAARSKSIAQPAAGAVMRRYNMNDEGRAWHRHVYRGADIAASRNTHKQGVKGFIEVDTRVDAKKKLAFVFGKTSWTSTSSPLSPASFKPPNMPLPTTGCLMDSKHTVAYRVAWTKLGSRGWRCSSNRLVRKHEFLCDVYPRVHLDAALHVILVRVAASRDVHLREPPTGAAVQCSSLVVHGITEHHCGARRTGVKYDVSHGATLEGGGKWICVHL